MTTNTIENYVEEYAKKLRTSLLWRDELNGVPVPLFEMTPKLAQEIDSEVQSLLTAVVKEAEKRGYAEGKAYWEPAEVHKEVWRQEGYELAKKHFKQIREEAGREVVNEVNAWAENAEVDIDEELNDPTSDFIANDAYESKLEAFHYGYNEALKNLRAFIKTIGIKL
jgi:hypothetical protein